jgi:eukaryotic-like serine/threonine-protein kinase
VIQTGAPIVVGVSEGDILAGKYRIEKILGAGGMGVVVAAQHVQLDERVAIKFLLPDVLGNAEAVGRFVREARAAVKIKSEHVARVIDVGTLENGSPYMVMEYLEGGDLGVWLQKQGPLPIEQAVEFILQACEAIAEAHGLGIVHRDLKPANLFCIRRADGLLSVKVLDFGISKVTKMGNSAGEARMTGTKAVFGSPMYMSPEQMLSSRDVDARTDIWAMGSILYELLTGVSPFDGDTLPEVFAKISTQPPPPIRNRRPDTPLELESAILKCLQKDRNNRYSNVAEMGIQLAPFAPKRARSSVERISRVIQNAGLSASALALPPSSGEMDPAPTGHTEVSWGHTAPPATGKRKWMIVGALVAVAALGIAATLFARKTARPGDRAAASNAVPTTVIAQPSASDRAVAETAPAAAPAATAASGTPAVSAAVAAAPAGSGAIVLVPTRESGSASVNATNPPAASAAKTRSEKGSVSVTGASASSSKAAAPKDEARGAKPAEVAAKPNCDPPYTLDSKGREVFKPECD